MRKESHLISLNSNTLRINGATIYNYIRATIPYGISAVLGANGSGKTTLAQIIEEGWNYMTNDITTPLLRKLKIRSIAFSDIHSLSSMKVEYYQQRFESMMNDEVPTVADLFAEKLHTPQWKDISKRLHLEKTVEKRLNYLSSGELRKLLIANMLFDLPDLLILDNPYIGLDADSREVLNDTLNEIAQSGVAVLLLLADAFDVAEDVGQVLVMDNMKITGPYHKEASESLDSYRERLSALLYPCVLTDELPTEMTESGEITDEVVKLCDCEVRYGKLKLIAGVNWSVRRGESWRLSGPNGSGKSTLLSLINADNPQSYSNDIWLFGRKRGSGESIWDIKKRIGYVSPEMHLYFHAGNRTAAEVIRSALTETPGFIRRITEEEQAIVEKWIHFIGFDRKCVSNMLTGNKEVALADCAFNRLSFGQQRLVLLARALVREPELLILDEPLHGLDSANKRAVLHAINTLMADPRRTLIYVSHYADEIPPCVTKEFKLIRQ